MREAGEAVQDCGPDEDEEEDDEEGDLPDGGVGGGPEEGPVAAGHGAEEVVLDYYHKEEPDYNLAAYERDVEGGDLAGLLTVVLWEAVVHDESDDPEQESNGDSNAGEGFVVGCDASWNDVV